MGALYTPPGGWCLTPGGNAYGLTSMVLTYGAQPLSVWLGGILYTLLQDKGVTANRVGEAIQRSTYANDAAHNFSPTEFAELVTALWRSNALLIENLANGMTMAANAGLRVVNTRLPLLQAQAAFEAATAQANANNYTSIAVAGEAFTRAAGDIATLQSAEAYTTTKVNALENYTNQGLESEGGYTRGISTQLLTYIETTTSDLATELKQTQTWVTTQITQTRDQAAQQAANAANQAVTATNVAVSQTLQPKWAGTATSVNQATKMLVAEHPTERQNLTIIPTVTPPTTQLALLGMLAAINTLTKVATDCALPECTAKNRIGKNANTLASLIGDGLLLAWLAYCIEDPTAAAQDTATVALPLANGVMDAVKALGTL